ncbi:alpha-amylase family protein [Actinocorallia longicatena]|uniref:Alpha-amylase n=1 Tax=Actinocorallia longicatena TaxID=111803 RepID=A0ABP6QP59_9ACTN
MDMSWTADLWWKSAVIYCLDVECYKDGDGDGIGDFKGLTQQVDYLERLGVTCIWLMPFFPSPRRDDGYDISDYYAVDPRLGTLGDLVEFLRTARDRGIRVIADLVVNHTSDQHPWFQDARSSRDSQYRDWYVWVDEPPADGPKDIAFPDQENSVWELDEGTGQYFLHRFYRFQPDLNISNPAVRDEIARILGFWMELGLSGFRVDAVPFMLETIGEQEKQRLPRPHEYLADLRAFLGRRDGDSVLLGEVNIPYPDMMEFFGDGRPELTMAFDFIGMQRMYLSMARGEAAPLAEALKERPEPPRDARWATFVRNHDELTLDKLTEDERNEVFAAFGPDEDMQVFGRGLRRRLPPMLDGDLRRMKLTYSMLFSLPGTPVLFYGEEIGMGENLDLPSRMAVRTPMQWRPDEFGGFSTAEPHIPMPSGDYAPEHVSVSAQRGDPDSLLSWTGMLAERYRQNPEMAWGAFSLVDSGDPAVLAYRYDDDDDGPLVILHNFADRPVTVTPALDGLDGRLVDLLQNAETLLTDETAFDLEPYGTRWLRRFP